MTKEEIIQKVLGYQMNPKDTWHMLESVHNIPVDMLDRIVGISPAGVTAGSGTITTTDTDSVYIGSNDTTTGNTTSDKYITETGTWDKAFAEEQNRRLREEFQQNYPLQTVAPPPQPAEEFNWDLDAPFAEPPKPKPIVVKPRNPGERRIVLED